MLRLLTGLLQATTDDVYDEVDDDDVRLPPFRCSSYIKDLVDILHPSMPAL